MTNETKSKIKHVAEELFSFAFWGSIIYAIAFFANFLIAYPR